MARKIDYRKVAVTLSVVTITLGSLIGAVNYVNGESKAVAIHIAKPWHTEAGELLKKQDTKINDIANRTISIEIHQQFQTECIEEGFKAIMEKLNGGTD